MNIYIYLIAYITTIFEGPIVMVASGLMIHMGIVSFFPILLVLSAGDLTGDIFWYLIGYYFGPQLIKKFGKFFSLTPERVSKTENLFQKHPIKILFLSKITLGFGLALATLVVAGMSKVPFKKYITTLFVGQIILTAMLLSVGYFFGGFYDQINQNMKSISLVLFFVVAFLIIFGVRTYFKNANRV